MRKTKDAGKDALHSLDEEILSLDAQIETLRGNYLGALLKQLKLVDQQNFDQLKERIQKLSGDFLDEVAKMRVGWFQSLVQMGDDDGLDVIAFKFKTLNEKITELSRSGNKKAIAQEIAEELNNVNFKLSESEKNSDKVNDALKRERDTLLDMQGMYDRINQKAGKQKEITNLTFDKDQASRLNEEVAAWDKIAEKIHAADEATRALIGTDATQQDQAIHKIDEEISKWEQLEEQLRRQFPLLKTYFGEEIAGLEARKKVLQDEITQIQNGFLLDRFKDLGPKMPDTSAKPIFGGTSDQLQLAKITADGPEASLALQKVLDSVETINQKFKIQSAELDELHAKYPQVFDAAMLKKAKDAIDPVRQAWSQFGSSISQTIISGQLFGSSWQSSLRSIGIELLQLILRMTLLKNLSGGLSGGFSWGGLLGGLFGGGKAEGGPVYQGQGYVVGEHGPEFFVPRTSGTIVPNGKAQGGDSGGVTIGHVQVDVHGVTDVDSFRKSKDQVAIELGAAIQRAARRNG